MMGRKAGTTMRKVVAPEPSRWATKVVRMMAITAAIRGRPMNATGGLTQLLMRTTIRTAINADGSHPAAGQRGDDDAALGTGCGIGVSAGGTAQDAVGAGDDVDVELGVDLQSGQDHVVQLVDVSALVAGVGVLAQIDLNVVGVGEQVSRSTLIKVLGVEDVVHQPLVLQSADGAGSAAQSKVHLDAGLLHVFLQEAVDGQRGAAGDGAAAAWA